MPFVNIFIPTPTYARIGAGFSGYNAFADVPITGGTGTYLATIITQRINDNAAAWRGLRVAQLNTAIADADDNTLSTVISGLGVIPM